VTNPGPPELQLAEPPADELHRPGSLRLGRFLGVPVFVSYSWFLIAAFISVSFAPLVARVEPEIGNLKYLVGFIFAVLFYLALLVHEGAHAKAAQYYGFRVDSITLHLLGGHTSIEGEARTPGQEFWIAIVGPIASLLVGGVAYAAMQWLPVIGLLWLTLGALALTNLAVGVLNLLPGLPLDGGRVLKAAWWQISGNPLSGTIAAGWGGRLLAILVALWPLWAILQGQGPPATTQIVLNLVLAAFLWTSATAAMAHAQIRRRIPPLRAADFARHAQIFPASTALAQVVSADDPDVPPIIGTNDAGQAAWVLSPERVDSVPVGVRDRTKLAEVSVQAAAVSLDWDAVGESLLIGMGRHPSDVYVLQDPATHTWCVLFASDIDQAFRLANPRA
jgi:Zn-dependent protease